MSGECSRCKATEGLLTQGCGHRVCRPCDRSYGEHGCPDCLGALASPGGKKDGLCGALDAHLRLLEQLRALDRKDETLRRLVERFEAKEEEVRAQDRRELNGEFKRHLGWVVAHGKKLAEEARAQLEGLQSAVDPGLVAMLRTAEKELAEAKAEAEEQGRRLAAKEEANRGAARTIARLRTELGQASEALRALHFHWTPAETPGSEEAGAAFKAQLAKAMDVVQTPAGLHAMLTKALAQLHCFVGGDGASGTHGTFSSASTVKVEDLASSSKDKAL